MAKSKRTSTSQPDGITVNGENSTPKVNADTLKEYRAKLRIGPRPDFYLPSEESLDFLLDHDIYTEDRLVLFLDRKAARDLDERLRFTWEWFDGFLESLAWFEKLSDRTLDIRTGPVELLDLDPDFALQREEFSRLLTDVMTAYVPAKMQTLPYSAQTGENPVDAVIQLLRKYWIFARRAVAFAREICPEYLLPETPNPVQYRRIMDCEDAY